VHRQIRFAFPANRRFTSGRIQGDSVDLTAFGAESVGLHRAKLTTIGLKP
jgi:hypothetical protein